MPDPRSMRVAVTGGAGFIGSHTVEMLVAAHAGVLVIDDHSHPCGEPLPGEVELVSADCGSEGVAKALAAFKPNPLSAHGAAKRSEEVYMAALGLRHGISTLALRYGNVYGPRQDGTGDTGIVAITCYRMLERAALRIYGDGGQTRDFVYVSDVVAANVAAVLGRVSGEVNIGTGRETNINAIVKRLFEESGRHTKTEYLPAREFAVRRVCLDPARARRTLSWKAKISVNAGLAATWAWFRKRHASQRAATLGLP